jgi:MerR HTH family regulatory protein
MTVAELTSMDVIDGTGLTYRQLSHWVRHGAVWPTRQGHGTGNHHRWSDDDRHRLRAIARVLDDLSNLGLNLPSHAFVRRLWQALDDTTYAELISGTITIRLGLEDT